jgi:hypothetical protein
LTEAPEAPPTVLFQEPGASWLWLLIGPIAGGSIAFIQTSSGNALDLTVPLIFFTLVTAFVAIQVKAARIHTSIELTAEYLRQGAETIRIEEIVKIYPPASGAEAPKWQSARALGELTGVPRGRTGIGLKLTADRTAQAWARRHRLLRATLTALVDEGMQ